MNNTIVDVLAIGAHPDDIELCCAGTLLRLQDLGYKIGIVDATRGEKGTRGTAEGRALEAQKALEIMGFEFRENLDLGDQHVQDTPDRRVKIVECIRRHKPKLVFTHHPIDRHPDHEGVGKLVKHAMFLSGAASFEAQGEIHVPHRLIYWMASWVHEPNFYVDITAYNDRKLEAAKMHGSQFYNPDSDEPPTSISNADFWEKHDIRHRWFGQQINVKYAEGFYVREKFKVDDPVAFFTL
ncbi:bacillithiol biosynthesis deacetylase BshB1 [bacterium]|nr:bacillithiol biosynthesis deacetylase BshB1 [bacterium]MBU1637934.1 bacillithiol biosynthesis deacetylase BshB1 [bacterium]